MRLSVKRFLRNARRDAVRKSRETRDGIIWAIDIPNRQVSVRIQGSNKLIKAWFPENWYSPPTWCKYGNAVRITHKGGMGDKFEVTGEGLVLPYPMTGQLWPDPPTEENAILSGLQLIPIPNEKSTQVMVTPGVVRIEGEEITVDAISMADGGDFNMSMGGFIDNVAAVLSCEPAPNDVGEQYPRWCYKIYSIQVNQEGDISISYSIDFAVYNGGSVDYNPWGNPDLHFGFDNIPWPEVPWGSLQIGTVFRWEFADPVIESFNINFELFKTGNKPGSRYGRIETRMTTEIEDPAMPWELETTDILVTVLDNVEQLAYFSWINLTVEIMSGNGQVRDETYGLPWGSSCTCHQIRDVTGNISYPQYLIGYKRGQDPSDESPLIKITLNTNNELISYFAITLLDADGNPM